MKKNSKTVCLPESSYFKKPKKNDLIAKNGKGDLFYNVHPYPTKVPVSILVELIEHYTSNNDFVLDPFCGSGSVGLAAKITGRNFYLYDLSPYAVHISKGYTELCSISDIKKATQIVLDNTITNRKNYNTTCRQCNSSVEASYWIWSHIFKCTNCKYRWTLSDKKSASSKVSESFQCPKCFQKLTISESRTDECEPLIVAYSCPYCKSGIIEDSLSTNEKKIILEHNKNTSHSKKFDLTMMNLPSGSRWGDQFRNGYHKNSTRVSSFFTNRNFNSLIVLWENISKIKNPKTKRSLQFAFTAGLYTSSKMVRCRPLRDGRSNIPGTLYLPPLFLEQNVFKVWIRRLAKVEKLKSFLNKTNSNTDFRSLDSATSNVLTSNSQKLKSIQSKSIDFILTDPPFGNSLQYAELNFIPESFLQKFTRNNEEMVINKTRNLSEKHYLTSFENVLREMNRVLKDDHYLCMIFNNTSPLIWSGIKEKIINSGFIIKTVSGIVKGHGSWNQTVHSKSTSRFDPVIHCTPNLERTQDPHINHLTTQESEKLSIELCLKIIEKFKADSAKYTKTLSYIHSQVIREMLLIEDICLPPTPQRLMVLLEGKINFEKTEITSK
jgi:DNA modification methylase